ACRGWLGSARAVSGAWHQRSHVLQVACQIRWHGCIFDGSYEGAGRREPPSAQDVHRRKAQGRGGGGGTGKKVVKPSRRREMAEHAVAQRGLNIRLACQAFRISQACYRYKSQRCIEDDEIAQWLLRLTDNNRSWGFGLCFLNRTGDRGGFLVK